MKPRQEIDEPLLRFAITNLENAEDHVGRLARTPSDGLLVSAVEKMQSAAGCLREWALRNEIELRKGMKT